MIMVKWLLAIVVIRHRNKWRKTHYVMHMHSKLESYFELRFNKKKKKKLAKRSEVRKEREHLFMNPFQPSLIFQFVQTLGCINSTLIPVTLTLPPLWSLFTSIFSHPFPSLIQPWLLSTTTSSLSLFFSPSSTCIQVLLAQASSSTSTPTRRIIINAPLLAAPMLLRLKDLASILKVNQSLLPDRQSATMKFPKMKDPPLLPLLQLVRTDQWSPSSTQTQRTSVWLP